MKKTLIMTAAILLGCSVANARTTMQTIGKSEIKLTSNRMTPEVLWSMGRISSTQASPNGKKIVYQVGYYSVEQNKGHQVLCVMDSNGKNIKQLTVSDDSETDPVWLSDNIIAFLKGGQIWIMAADGTQRKQLTNEKTGIDAFKFSPNGKKVILIKQISFNESIKKNPSDLPKASGRLITDLNYRHWDEYVEKIPHPFIANVTEDGVDAGKDIMESEPFECPMKPFGGIEQLAWSPDSKFVAYTSRKKTGVQYATSTDSDIYMYDIESGKTINLCKPKDYKAPEVDPTKSFKNQAVNSTENLVNNPGYDTNPKFSPDGNYVAWQSMARDGYESDRNRLCIYTIANGEKKYITEDFDSNVDDYCWMNDSKTLTFIGVWHGCINMYRTNLNGKVEKLTDDWADYTSVSLANDGSKILATRQSMQVPTDIYIITPQKNPAKTKVEQITFENQHILDQLALGKIQQRWVETTDGEKMLYWIILPSNFDPNKKYPTLLFCEGGPQSPVSQFWSYRWNMQIMAANDYVIIAPNRHGLPGFGSKWCEEISGDWTGQCMDDYLTAIDDAANKLSFIDKDRLAAVGASFGGFSVYYLAGHHNKRFKCFIAHDGAFNLESMYTDTEEAWFSNWEYDDAYWNKNQTENAKRTYMNSPHRFVDKWDTPILCIHGEKDYRINANQGFGAFNAARLRGIPAELLLFPDENHWVLKPQNGILWQRTYFDWLKKWLR